jgi:ABC-type multidrug transport system fused ATPase/permease subunit
MASLDYGVLTFILSLAGVVIMGLLIVLWYLLRQFISEIVALKGIVNQLNSSVLIIQTLTQVKDAGCVDRHSVIDERLKGYSETIKALTEKITILETKSA